MAVSFKYGGEAMALIGIAYGLIKWVGRNLRSLISDAPLEAARLEGIAAHTPVAAADALVRQGIVSADDLSGMKPRERDFLIATAGPRVDGAATGARPPRLTPGASAPIIGAFGPGGRPRSASSPRLHLITPSRPPLGVTVHCPGCGAPLDREALQKFGETTCPRCKRAVSAHIQRGRLTVIIDETPDEADHRRRLEGGQ